MSTVVPVFGANLGDILWVTPLARHIPDLVVHLRDNDEKVRATAPILQHTCAHVFDGAPTETPKAQVQGHVTQQILKAYDLEGKPSIPRVILTADEIRWAIDFLYQYGGPKRVAVVAHCSGVDNPTNHRARYVQGSVEDMEQIAKFWKGAGYTVFQFAPAPTFYSTDIFTPFKGCVHIRGLTVRQLAACYYVIGRLISVDTGDYHLMLAVGGRVAAMVPPHNDGVGYRHWDLHYDATCWGDEKPRVTYIPHADWWRAMDINLFKTMGEVS